MAPSKSKKKQKAPDGDFAVDTAMDRGDAESVIDSWHLDANVRRILQKENFTSPPALLAMTEDDLRALDIRGGDRAVLRAAATRYQTANGGGPLANLKTATPTSQTGDVAMTPTGTPTGTPGASLLHELLQPREQATAGSRVDLNPQIYLQAGKGEIKALLIPDFIPQAAHEVDGEIELGNGATLRLINASKPKLHTVSPAQWIAANARIMAELCDKGVLDNSGIKDYMAYTVKVGELACRYTWASVLAYDNEYRARQAATRFRWGSDSQHLSTVTLREKATLGTPPKRLAADPGNSGIRRRAPGGKEVCLQYNSIRGCHYGVKCNFEHVCLMCSGSHPRVEHRQQGTSDATPRKEA